MQEVAGIPVRLHACGAPWRWLSSPPGATLPLAIPNPSQIDETTLEITELPIRKWTQARWAWLAGGSGGGRAGGLHPRPRAAAGLTAQQALARTPSLLCDPFPRL